MSEPPRPPDGTPPPDPNRSPGGYGPPPAYPSRRYPSQHYPSQPYPGQPQQGQPYPGQSPYPAPPSVARPPFSVRFGARLRQRPEPRLGTSLAAVGAVLVLVGVLLWAGGYLIAGIHFNFDEHSGRSAIDGESRRFLGVGLLALVIAAGYALVIVRRRGPLASAGVVASAFAVPTLFVFLTLDLGGGDPVSLDAIYLVSIVVWFASYLFIPGAQGRSFYLGLAALSFASYVALKSGGDTAAIRAGVSVAGGGLAGLGNSGAADALTAVGLLFGVAYYGIAAFLDRQGRHGAAVGLVVAAFFTTTSGVTSAAASFGQIGAGVLLVVLGAALAWYGGWAARRFTTWVWSFGFAAGLGLIVQKALPDSTTGAGIVLLLIGVVVVAAAAVVSRAIGEKPDIDDGVVA